MTLTGHYIRESMRVRNELEAALGAEHKTPKCAGCGGNKSPSIGSSFYSTLCDRCMKWLKKVDREKAKAMHTAYGDGHTELLAWALDILHADPAINPPEMKIAALTPWFGGKRTLAPSIVTELGEHTQYFEPMCGSMAVLLAKKPSQKETVCDLHGDLINQCRTPKKLRCCMRDCSECFFVMRCSWKPSRRWNRLDPPIRWNVRIGTSSPPGWVGTEPPAPSVVIINWRSGGPRVVARQLCDSAILWTRSRPGMSGFATS